MKPIEWRRTRFGRFLRHLPRPKHLRGTWLHRKLGDGLLETDLWKPRRSKVAGGFALGAFFSMMPMPFQMIPTLLLGYFTRVNLPAALVGVWISNPLTTPAILYLQYKIGHALLGIGTEKVIDETHTWVSLIKEAPAAILCGAMVTGVLASAICYPIALRVWDFLDGQVKRSNLRRAKRKKISGESPISERTTQE